MRLIDADALVEFLLKEIIECDKEYDETSEHTILGAGQEAELIRDKVKEMPTVDIVRCKDCKWYVPYSGEGCTEGDCYGTDICMTADDFCSRGERKEERGKMIEETPRPVMLYVEDVMLIGKEIVFCKDCKYWADGYCDDSLIEGLERKVSRFEDDFCSRGEKR